MFARLKISRIILGFVCRLEGDELIEDLNELISTDTVLHRDCSESWDYTYQAPPQDCHRVNGAMRDYLRYMFFLKGGVPQK